MFEISAGLALLLVLIVAVTILIVLVISTTTSRDSDQMGFFGTLDYRRFLKRKPPPPAQFIEIPLPPDGKRDPEVEALIYSGQFREARDLLQTRLEDAKLAPVGREAQIKRVAHYTSLLGKE